MHPLIKAFGLTLANFAALCCAALTFYCYFWCANPLEAVLPCAVVVLFCVFQPWLAVVSALCGVALFYGRHLPQSDTFVVAVGLFSAFLSSLMTCRIYRRVFLRGKLTGLLRHQSRIRAGIIGFLCLASLLSFAGYRDLPRQNATLDTTAISQIPLFSDNNLAGSATNVYSYVLPLLPLADGYQVLWQAHVPRAQMAHFEVSSGMQRVQEGTFSRRFWDKPPYWWRRPQGQIEAYKGSGFSEDGLKDGGHSEAAVYDPRTETLFLWEQWIE